jgi:hypothetical protein
MRELGRLGKCNGGQSRGTWKIDGTYMLVAPCMANSSLYDDPVKVLTRADCYQSKHVLSYGKAFAGN